MQRCTTFGYVDYMLGNADTFLSAKTVRSRQHKYCNQSDHLSNLSPGKPLALQALLVSLLSNQYFSNSDKILNAIIQGIE